MDNKVETSTPVVHQVYLVQTNKAKLTKKAPHQIMMFSDMRSARFALDQIRKLREITPKFGGHRIVKRVIKIDGGMFDVWCITERVVQPHA